MIIKKEKKVLTNFEKANILGLGTAIVYIILSVVLGLHYAVFTGFGIMIYLSFIMIAKRWGS